MESLILVIHVLLALALVGLVLLQHGKGADAGAAFGSGASATVFGASGSATFLSKTTTVIAALFFVTSLSLAYFAAGHAASKSVVETLAAPADKVPGDAAPAAGGPEDVPSVPQ